jgi:hypothetical protein
VLEANAFGDLLPNLTIDGASVWQWEIREALRQVAARSSGLSDGAAPFSASPR